jgi:hypothetical protein
VELVTECYSARLRREASLRDWIETGRHIFAYYDYSTMLLYGPCRSPSIEEAVAPTEEDLSSAGGIWTWFRPGFFAAMHAAAWGAYPNQEFVLALRVPLQLVDRILEGAIPLTWEQSRAATRDHWQRAVSETHAVIDWEPDRNPHGQSLSGLVPRIGLRSELRTAVLHDELLEVIDLTSFAARQRRLLEKRLHDVAVPFEWLYSPRSKGLKDRLKLHRPPWYGMGIR